ncbi:Fe3+ hydroxamate ABC transporter substrate-binding protein [Vibrio cholerae]|nr:Fe3+ hydroxamate ABC transporter substrate-binding protein [Vibrio cholerae]PAR36673.1 Fe3+ hydroxamate ABC transporter substrate-binding protein [Vibrio metoecus]EHU0376586.1 Fe3+ hydroxamate ABC transporter substrate-binding protein [Vibrio cholerae]EIA4709940.1 Fe3+ hydroxamate ABC transporter substrate-binding protein [Vibrio cholerae]EIC9802995.1 Fe3+ hydroxamate ABC transporter substrate-binding protein [Vibrio cholerae]
MDILNIAFAANQYVLNGPQVGSFLLFGPCLALLIKPRMVNHDNF